MLEASASQVPYGGQQLGDHLRHFLVQQRCSLITEVESYLIRRILEEVGTLLIELFLLPRLGNIGAVTPASKSYFGLR